MPFPAESNHLRHWVFTQDELHETRKKAHDHAASKIEKYARKKSVTLLTTEDELFVVEYYAQILLQLGQHKNLRPVIKETAACFFRRFFLKRSIMEFDPRNIIFTCITLAIKAEEYSRRHQISELFGDMIELDTQEVIKLELPVCEALEFHLLVLHTREPLLALRNACLDKLKELLKPSPDKEKELQQLAHDVYQRAENLSIAVQETDIPLMYTPSHLAIGSFLYYGKVKLHSYMNVDE
eukprot:GHVQ01024300.1.p1 GENE.GHVQ01024300.1~~GHVQ01024300.1.p1  ORF type:complete len:239 (-),score=18.69 GHVQ01024300.1:1114-1830(-)